MAIATYLNPGAELGAAVELARMAERLGYDSVWVTHGLGRDSSSSSPPTARPPRVSDSATAWCRSIRVTR
jgi:alkanesulfonate monooxygenase SsuD/methylene tetrahydromethanopterin reductase-like flavin-dependent oxidoreductase (luciferase family)